MCSTELTQQTSQSKTDSSLYHFPLKYKYVYFTTRSLQPKPKIYIDFWQCYLEYRM